jgi:hypothetical protein
MITVSEEVQRIVNSSPYLADGLYRGILNLSALAREIRPQIEATLLKEVSQGAIVMALKRLADSLDQTPGAGESLLHEARDLMVRSNLSELTYLRSETTITNQKRLLDQIQSSSDSFVTFSQGVYETTIVVSSRLKDKVETIFQAERQISQLNDLSAIVIKLPAEAVAVPGIHYPILKQLAWKGVSVIQLVSTFTELTIILDRQKVDLAFSVLLSLLSPDS